MNIHEQINAELARQYEALRDAEIVGPATLAYGAYQAFATGDETPHIQYGSVEYFKAMARKFLARRVEPAGEENQAHNEQSSFNFSKQLQDRYPLPRDPGQEPVYKQRSRLTAEERAWNVLQLRKYGTAFLAHADALEAEGLSASAA